MSTTRDDLLARDGFSYQWVLAIDGYEHIITDGLTAAALTAWAATSWSTALGGLSVNCDFDQSLEAFDAFSSARSMTFSVMDVTDADTFGIDVARPAFGAKTWLSAAIDANDTTITVKDTTAFTSSGTIYIGTERIAYTGKTATTFTGCTRGKYSAFNRDGVTTNEFGRAHNIPSWDFNVQIQPIVSQYPQTFIGRWVGLWMHRKRAGVLDTKAESILIYAGKISDIRDSGNGITTVACTDILDVVKDSTLHSDPLELRIREGIEVTLFDKLQISVHIDGTASAYMYGAFTPGVYTIDELVSEINSFAAALPSTSATSAFSLAIVNTQGGWRVEASARNTTAGSKQCSIGLTSSKRVIQFLGLANFDNATSSAAEANYGAWVIGPFTSHATNLAYKVGEFEPLRVADSGIHSAYNNSLASNLTSCYFDSARGTFIDQADSLPQGVATVLQSTGQWGLWMMAGRLYLGKYDEANSKVSNLEPIKGFMETKETESAATFLAAGRLAYSAKPEDMFMRQIVVLEGDMRDLVVGMACGTSVPGYNHANYDRYGGSLGAAIPYEPLSSLYESLSRIDGATVGNGSIVVLEKPTTFKELFNADMIMRQAFIHWHNGSLRVARWAMPRAAKAVASLTESNKAGQLGDAQRTVTERTDRHMRNVIKIEYNRVPGKDTYESSFQFVDVASVQNYGNERAVTIKARNSYGDYATTGDSVKSLAPNLLSILPMFSRPRFECRRTIDHTLYEKLYPGAVVSVTDNFMRDPSTGQRGVINRAAICMRIRYDFGGWEFDGGAPRQQFGEADFLMLDADDGKPLCPSAVVDIAFTSGPYVSGFDGVQSLRTVPKEFAASSESEDLAAFAVGDEVSIIEINPDNPASPIQIDCTISVIASLYYFAVDVLLAPAGFVAGREYKIVPREYAGATTSQKAAYTYLADSTYTVDAARDAYTFGEDDDTRPTLSLSSAVPYESGGKIAEHNAADADGPPIDVATIDEMFRAVNHLCDARTATVGGNLRAAGAASSVFVMPIYFSAGTITGTMRRDLTISVICESTSGITNDIMVYLSDAPPTQINKGAAFAVDDLRFNGRTFGKRTTVATASGVTEKTLAFDITQMADAGKMWLTVAAKTSATSANITLYGISQIQLGVRTGI